MALTQPIAVAKELIPLAYQPLLLCTFTMTDGTTIFRASTHPLNATEGGFTYLGNDYLCRVNDQLFQAIQSRSENGIDRIPSLTIQINDPDKLIWANFELVNGFKGAILDVVEVFWEADTGNFSSDSHIKFRGICDGPVFDQGLEIMSISATSAHNMQKVYFPIYLAGQRCMNQFARNAAERLAGGTDMGSWQWGCGYDPDMAGTDPEIGGDCRRGNLTTPNLVDSYNRTVSDAGGRFIICDYTKAACVARGMYTQDSSSRKTGRFNGVQWGPINRLTKSVSFTQGKTIEVFSSRNDSIYGKPFPMVYAGTIGTISNPNQPAGGQWVNCEMISVELGDANSTRFLVTPCMGNIGPNAIVQVVVNGVIIPRNFGPGSPGLDPLFRWNFIGDSALGTAFATGGRNGIPCNDALFDSNGDPFGSLATIEIVVPIELVDSASLPTVRILTRGPAIKVPNTTNPADQASWPYKVSSNPAWVIMDLLIWANYKYSELDIQTFMDAAAFSDVQINYQNLAGVLTNLNVDGSPHRRYAAEFVIDQRRTAAEVIQAVLNCFNAQLVANNNSGLLQLFIRQSLADQQPNPVPGSNYNTAVGSLTALNATASGYVAYLIDESVIATTGPAPEGKPIIRTYIEPNASTPNRVNFRFQDRDNSYSDDSLSQVDPDDVARCGGYLSGQELAETLPILGISNFDQGIRAANVKLAENFRCNEENDTRGTRYFEFESNFRLEHLRVGHICLFNYQQLELGPFDPIQSPPGVDVPGILVRVIESQPMKDAERWRLKVAWHEDLFYTDIFAQLGAQLLDDPRRHRGKHPYPWKPGGVQPMVSDALEDQFNWNFAVREVFDVAADATSISQIAIGGYPPVNDLSPTAKPPLVPIEGGTGNSGGFIPGGRSYILGITAVDADGKQSALSHLMIVGVPVGTNTNTIDFPQLFWMAGTVGYVVYGGIDSQHMGFQTANLGTPTSITLNTLFTAYLYGPPDLTFDHFVYDVTLERHAGVFGAQVTSVGVNTLGFAGQTFTPGQFAGCVISRIANAEVNKTGPVLIQNFLVVTNGPNSLQVFPDPSTFINAVQVGDVFTLRARGTVATDSTIGDPNFLNSASGAGLGLTVDAEIGKQVFIAYGTGAGQVATITGNTDHVLTVSPKFSTVPDATSLFVILDPAKTVTIAGRSMSAAFSNPGFAPESFVNLPNFAGTTVRIRVRTATADDNESLETPSPSRDMYLWGGTFGYVEDAIDVPTQTATPDLADGLVHEVTLISPTQITIGNPIWTGGNIQVGTDVEIVIKQDATGYRPTPAWGSLYTGMEGFEIDPRPGKWTTFVFEVRKIDSLFQLKYASILPPRSYPFGIGMPGDVVVGTDVAPRDNVDVAGVPVLATIQAKVVPTGADLIVDILIQRQGTGAWTSIFDTTKLVLPAGSALAATQTTFLPGLASFAIGDLLRCDVLQVGSTAAGQQIIIKVKTLATG